MIDLPVAVIRRATEKAIQVILDAPDNPIWWLPRSQIEDGDTYQAGERDIVIRATEWIVRQKEIADGNS